MSNITTHVLDLGLGRPAPDLQVQLQLQLPAGTWQMLAQTVTDAHGRIADFGSGPLQAGVYRLRFETLPYFEASARSSFFAHVEIAFVVTQPGEHHHVPLLLSPFGYSTYRGS